MRIGLTSWNEVIDYTSVKTYIVLAWCGGAGPAVTHAVLMCGCMDTALPKTSVTGDWGVSWRIGCS